MLWRSRQGGFTFSFLRGETMFSVQNYFLIACLLSFFELAHAENSIELAHDRHGSQWFLIRTPGADGAGLHAARLRVEFPRPRSFHSFHQVKTAHLFVRFSCPTTTMEIERINLLGEAGDEIAGIPATGSAQSAAHHLPETIMKSAFGHACTTAQSS